MDDRVQQNASPWWPKDLRYTCPHCRAGIELIEGRSARCPHCSFEMVIDRGVYRFVPQTGTINDWQDTYDKVATGSLGDTGAGLLYRSPLHQRVATFRHLCGEVSAGARILDVGCADGVFWQALLDRRPVVGIDFSFEMCLLARNLGMLAHQADALALPFADGQFDLIYCAGLLEHVDDLSKLFAELSRVCRIGGRIVVGTANKVSLARRAMRVVRRVLPASLEVMRRPIVMRTIGELVLAAGEASLDLDRVCWSHFPLQWERCSSSASNVLAPLATNVYARFKKR